MGNEWSFFGVFAGIGKNEKKWYINSSIPAKPLGIL